eukprot:1185748-Prorocentrum_minimum.AAC.2
MLGIRVRIQCAIACELRGARVTQYCRVRPDVLSNSQQLLVPSLGASHRQVSPMHPPPSAYPSHPPPPLRHGLAR